MMLPRGVPDPGKGEVACDSNTYPCIYNPTLPQGRNESSLQACLEDIEILSGSFNISQKNEAKGH